MIIVHEIEPGVFVRWPSGHPLMVTCRKEMVLVQRAGVTVSEEERDCEPYEIEERAPTTIGAAFWKNHSDDELADRKLYRVNLFVAPEGKRTVGEPGYERVDGVVVEMYAVEDIPPPPPPPTVEQKLAAAGLNEAELDELIQKSLARQAAMSAAGGKNDE